jgi:hypothetical protein
MCLLLVAQVLGPRRPGHAGEGFAKAALLAEVSLRPEGPNEAPAGHRAVALGAGYLDPKREELVRALRKQVCATAPRAKSPEAVNPCLGARALPSLENCSNCCWGHNL